MFIVAESFLLFLSKCLFPSVITSPALHLLFLRLCYACILFSLTSVCCAPCAVIPPAICNCFRSATKNEKRNEDPDSRGSCLIKSKRILRILSAFPCNNNRELEVQNHVSAKKVRLNEPRENPVCWKICYDHKGRNKRKNISYINSIKIIAFFSNITCVE